MFCFLCARMKFKRGQSQEKTRNEETISIHYRTPVTYHRYTHLRDSEYPKWLPTTRTDARKEIYIKTIVSYLRTSLYVYTDDSGVRI
jgi:hypothetical protein